jgi:site-specific DNA-methyltransferase (adenine-specific)
MAEKVVIGNAELWHGDCLEVLPLLPKTAAIVSDPPYGMGWNVDSTRFSGGDPTRKWCRANAQAAGKKVGNDDWKAVEGDSEPFDPAPWLAFPKCVLWGFNHYASRLPVGTTLIWLKKHDAQFGTFLSDAELAWMKGGHGVYAYRKTFTARTRAKEAHGTAGYDLKPAHPTQKPEGLMAWCIEKVGRPEVVADPYMGSGSTGVAAMNLGLRFIGVEIHRPYFDIACARIEAAQRQAALHL